MPSARRGRSARRLEAALPGDERERRRGRDVSCLGQCDGAPAVSINDHIYRDVTPAQAEALVLTALGGSGLPECRPKAQSTGWRPIPMAKPSTTARCGQLVATRDWDGVIAQLKASGLSGLGGAGFPTGVKWEAVRKAPGAEKYVVCNADESEPGTIKDRFIMEHLPHLVIEGMIIAGLVTGARKGILYIRHEYEAQEHILARGDRALLRTRAFSARTCWAPDSTFDLELFVSPGGYICGEESALIEAIEGKRAEPRNKPPFPVTHGVLQQADGAEQCGDVRQRAADSGRTASTGTKRRAGRRGGAEVRRRQRRCAQSGRLRNPDGDADVGSDLQPGGRHRRREEVEGVRAVGSVVGLSAGVDGGCRGSISSRWRRSGRCWGRARSWSAPKAAACSTWR